MVEALGMLAPGSGAEWGEPVWLLGLAAAPAVWLVCVLGARGRRRGVRRMVGDGLRERLGARAAGLGRVLYGPMLALAVALVALALARPRWDPQAVEVTRQGREVVFVIDVSRSMLAQDLAPSRLERAKLWVRDLVRTLRGDRVGLVAFAGAAVVKCPLTTDYAFFRLALEELAPESVPRGGTNIGDAIRKVMSDVYVGDPAGEGHRDIVLMTDGEDQESLPIEAAEAAGRAGVRIIALGLGSDVSGATIPVEDGQGRARALTFRGETVQSRQDTTTLARIATASAGGVYLNVGTGNIDLDRVYHDLVRSAEQTTTTTGEAMRYQEGFVWVLLAALGLLFFETLGRERSVGSARGGGA